MKNSISIIPYILLSLGTLGLLTGEFLIYLGRTATLVFAALNIIGLIGLVVSAQKNDSP